MRNMSVRNLLNITATLSTEKNIDKLFALILKKAIEITNCKSGALYMFEGEVLRFRSIGNNSMEVFKGENGEKLELPPIVMDRRNICSFAAMEKKVININEIDESTQFDFSEYRRYDSILGTKAISTLVVPMENPYGEAIGVLQLINALDGEGNAIAFNKTYENAIIALSSLAAVCITNTTHLDEIRNLFDSFVSAISSAIDERTPYNASHTRNMVAYAKSFLSYMNNRYMRECGSRFFGESQEEEFIMSVWLHDMGKMAIPTKVMNKKTKLGESFDKIKYRFKQMILLNKIAYLENKITLEEFLRVENEIEKGLQTISKANGEGKLQDIIWREIKSLAGNKYIDYDGIEKPWISAKEVEMLKITRGTLTDDERHIMENHVIITKSLLEEINFTSAYKHVVEWAANHHEFIDGSGYPRRLKGEQLSTEMRLITILDIFDALTATDRPYKKPIPVKKALEILEHMAQDGKLDKKIVSDFIESQAWKVNSSLKN
ncbi:MAG: HD-GYP domain-containing protein [Aminipila sp.]